MLAYQRYLECGGSLSEIEFDQLMPKVCQLINSYIQNLIPYWKVKPLNVYGIDFSEEITMQIDFIDENGGISALHGNSDFNVSSVSTKGFTYKNGNRKRLTFNGIPLSPMMVSGLHYKLRSASLMTRRL